VSRLLVGPAEQILTNAAFGAKMFQTFLLIALVQCSSSFDLVMSPFMNPANRRIASSDVSQQAKKISTIGGALRLSNIFQSQKVFETFIINQDLNDVNELVAAKNFIVPMPSIFEKPYKNEFEFGKALYETRLRPKLENEKVLILMA
jgi:hypothetical protein